MRRLAEILSLNGLTGSDSGRERLTADRTYYVRPDGSNANNGLTDSAGGAFLTIQNAVDVVCGLDLDKYAVTIQLADGTWNETVRLKSYLGAGPVTVKGNITTPANVVINGGAGNCFEGEGAGYWKLNGMKLTASGQGIYASGAMLIKFLNMDFGACYAHVFVTNAAAVQAETNYSITGGGSAHVYAIANGSYDANNLTVTLTGTPNFAGGFYWSDRGAGFFSSFGNTYTGSATGKKYNIALTTVIFTSGSTAGTYLPGGTSGSAVTGAVYS